MVLINDELERKCRKLAEGKLESGLNVEIRRLEERAAAIIYTKAKTSLEHLESALDDATQRARNLLVNRK